MRPAGKRDQKLTIEEKSVTRDAVGGEVVTWVEFAAWWAELVFIRADERVELRKQYGEQTLRFRGLYLPAVTNAMRVQWEGNPYEIVELLPRRTDGELELLVTGAANG